MITSQQAADAVTYLVASGATIARDAQGPVWADYLNYEVPDTESSELVPACRRAIRDWITEGRSWQVDVGRYAQALRRERSDRLAAYRDAHGLPHAEALADDVPTALAWEAAARDLIRRSSDRPSPAEVEAHAWRSVGLQPPPALPAGGDVLGGVTGPDRAREVLRRLRSDQNRAQDPAGRPRRGATVPAYGSGRERPSESLTRNRPDNSGGSSDRDSQRVGRVDPMGST